MKTFGIAILCIIGLLSGCGGGGSTNSPSSGNLSIGAITGPTHLQIGVKAASFVYLATVSGSSNTAVTWSVDDPSLAMIDSNTGLATPSVSKTGTVTFTATAQADPSTKSTLKVRIVDWILTQTNVEDADGSTYTELVPTSLSYIHCAWTPDHLGFVCVSLDPNTALGTKFAFFKSDGTAAGTTQTATLDLKALGGLIWVVYPSFSPDGTKIVFYGMATVAGNGVWGTFVVDTDGKSAPVMLATDPYSSGIDHGPPRFSPDGKTILYIDDWTLWSMNADGTNQRQIVINALNGILSPDQGTLYYTGYDFTVYKANPDGTNAVAIGILGDELAGVSPNGLAIVLANRYPPPSFGMYTENGDGTGRKQIATGWLWASW